MTSMDYHATYERAIRNEPATVPPPTFSRDACYGAIQHYTCNRCFMGGIVKPATHVCKHRP